MSDTKDHPTSEPTGLTDATHGRITWQPEVARSALLMTTGSARRVATAGVAAQAQAWYERLAHRLRSTTAWPSPLLKEPEVDSETVAATPALNALRLASLRVANSDNGPPVQPRLVTSVPPGQPRREITPNRPATGPVMVRLEQLATVPLARDEIRVAVATQTEAVPHERRPIEDQKRIPTDRDSPATDLLAQPPAVQQIEARGLWPRPTAHSIVPTPGGFVDFVEHLAQPIAAPGLELLPHPASFSPVQPVTPPERAFDHVQPSTTVEGSVASHTTSESASAAVGPLTQAALQPNAPAVPDIDMLAERVAERLRRRERAERERRGGL